MFNVLPNGYVPGFRVSPTEDVPGFRVNTNGQGREAVSGTGHATFADYARGAKTAPLDFLSANPAHYGFIDGDAGSAVERTSLESRHVLGADLRDGPSRVSGCDCSGGLRP